MSAYAAGVAGHASRRGGGASASLQTKSPDRSADADAAARSVETAEAAVSGAGAPLTRGVRAAMERKLRTDLSHVRIYTDATAARTARAFDASAYTVGHRVAFDEGRYAPHTQTGRRLLAHELTHVVQQGGRRSRDRRVSTATLEREADGIAASIDRVGELDPPRVHGGLRVSCAPRDAHGESDDEHKRKRKLREDDVDRSFLGLGADDQRPAVDPGTTPAPIAPNRPISTAADSDQAFRLNMAQRGFDYVGDLRQAIHRNDQKLASLSERRTTTQDVAEQAALAKEIDVVQGRLDRDRRLLRNVSTPQVKDEAALVERRDEFAKQLEGKLTPARRARIDKAIASLDEQIGAVRFANAHPDAPAPLSALEGTALGSPKLHTFVTIQITTADGRVLLFQARNVPGGDHAEDVILRRLAESHASKDQGLAGAKMVIFGDQEVCARCQKRVPEYAKTLGIHDVEGYTTHAPALARDGTIKEGVTVAAKTTMLEVSDAAAIDKRLQAQRRVPGHEADESVTLVQKKTFAWRNPEAPPDASAPAVKSGGSAGDHASNVGTIAKNGTTSPPPAGAAAAPHPDAAPTRATPTPASHDEGAVSALNKADMGLAAIRDFRRYREQSLAAGMSEREADANAAARAGVTLGANLKGGPLAAVINAGNSYQNAIDSGQSQGEALATTVGTVGGGLIANKVAPTSVAGATVQLINTGAQALGAPQPVQDATYGAAELVPSNIVGTTLSAGARSYYALGKGLTGDLHALDHLAKDMETGGLGPWIQGYTQVTGIAADMASGDDFEKAINKAGKAGKGSWADRVGGGLGDAASDFGENKEAMAGKYGASAGGLAIALNITSGLARGEGFSESFHRAEKAFAEGRKTLDADRQAKAERTRAAIRAKFDAAKTAASRLVDDGKRAVVAGVGDVKTKVAVTLQKTEVAVNAAIDTVTTVAKQQIDHGEVFIRQKAAESKARLQAGWSRLWDH